MIINKVLLTVLTVIILVSCKPFIPEEGKIIINNQSPSPLSEVSVEYRTSEKVDLIGDIAPNSTYEYTLEYPGTEDSVYINYTHNKKMYSDNVIPYGGKYDKKSYTFNIE